MAEEQIDYGEEEYAGAQKILHQGSGAIPALVDEELMGEDDEYDDLYNDVNIGDGILQLQRSEAPTQPGGTLGNGLQVQRNDATGPRIELASQGLNNTVAPAHGRYPNAAVHFHDQKEEHTIANKPEMVSSGNQSGSSFSQKANFTEMAHDTQVKSNFPGSTLTPPKVAVNPFVLSQRIPNDPAQYSGTGGPQSVPQIPGNQMGMNANQHMGNENQIQPPLENGSTMLFVGELHWWTTDAELESVLSQYGRVKEIKFFDERASGKSKGYCQVEFYDAAAAAACKEGMNGHVFNGRACVVTPASSQTMKQLVASYKSQGGAQSQPQGRRPNEGFGRGGNMNYQGGDAGRNFVRGAWPRGGQGVPNRPGPGGPMRGRGAVGSKNMFGNPSGAGNGAAAIGGYAQGPALPVFGGPGGGMMHPQSMMGGGFDPYMGRGGGFSGFPGPSFPGMLPSFPAVNAMGLAGVAPHVNPAIFGRGMAPNGIGIMGSSGMDGLHGGMWTDTGMGGWGGDEHGHRTRESSYGGEDGASEHGYGEPPSEKGRSSAASREKERVAEREWSGNSDRRHRDERERDYDRYERDHREHRYREDKDGYREHRLRERDLDYEDDFGRGQSSSRSRSRSHAMPEEDHRSRSRDVDYGKRRRQPSE